MLRFLAGVASSLLLVAAGFFLWTGRAGNEQAIVPPAPAPTPLLSPLKQERLQAPPSASPKSKEEKRFGRADKNKDGRITRDELLQPRRKAYDKLDTNRDSRLSFEEWTVKTSEKFAGADADRSGWLSAREYETTKPKVKSKPKCRC